MLFSPSLNVHFAVPQRPLAATVVGLIYIVVGLAGLVFHMADSKGQLSLCSEITWISAQCRWFVRDCRRNLHAPWSQLGTPAGSGLDRIPCGVRCP